MKLTIKKVLKFLKKPWLIIFLLAIAGASFGFYSFYKGKQTALYDTAFAQRGDIAQEVSVTGRVRPAEEAELAFEKAGRVNRVNISVGQHVKAGQILAQLESSELSAQLNEAQMNLEYQKAKLEEAKKGSRPEEIQIAETKVANAQTTLKNSEKDLIYKIKDSHTKSDDAVRNKVDQIFNNSRGSDPQLKFTVYSGQLEIDLESGRYDMEKILNSWQISISVISESDDLDFYMREADSNLSNVRDFLEKAALAVNSLNASASLSQTTIDAYRSDISTARTNINTAITNLTLAEDSFKDAQSSLVLYQNELVLERAGNTAEQIAAQEAQMRQAEASIDVVRAQLGKNYLISPINGIVTKKDVKIGEIVAINQPAVSVISDAQYELEANIPEADIAKIKIGNSAKVTLDAYGNEAVFEAAVVKIEPAETMIEGVATYKTTLQFTKNDERVKSGMTANIDILAAKHENAIFVPQRAIIGGNGDKKIRIVEYGEIKEVKIKAGLRGSDGNTEILEGVKEGDEVIIFMKEE